MKITIKQLKQLIREQVEMAMHEDETVFMPQASEEVKKAVETINASDALAKNWAKRNLKLENAKRRLRRLHENEEQMPSKQEVMTAAKSMTPEEAIQNLKAAGIDYKKLLNNPKAKTAIEKVAKKLKSGDTKGMEQGMLEGGRWYPEWVHPGYLGATPFAAMLATGMIANLAHMGGLGLTTHEQNLEILLGSLAVVIGSAIYDKLILEPGENAARVLKKGEDEIDYIRNRYHSTEQTKKRAEAQAQGYSGSVDRDN